MSIWLVRKDQGFPGKHRHFQSGQTNYINKNQQEEEEEMVLPSPPIPSDV